MLASSITSTTASDFLTEPWKFLLYVHCSVYMASAKKQLGHKVYRSEVHTAEVHMHYWVIHTNTAYLSNMQMLVVTDRSSIVGITSNVKCSSWVYMEKQEMKVGMETGNRNGNLKEIMRQLLTHIKWLVLWVMYCSFDDIFTCDWLAFMWQPML